MGFFDGPQIGNVIDQEPGGEGFYSGGPAYQAVGDTVVIENFRDQAAASATASETSHQASLASANASAASASAASTSASNAATSAANAASAVQAVAGTATPLVDGTAAVGTSTKWAHEDHKHPADTATADARIANAAGTVSPAAAGTATTGTSTKWAHEDHVHPTDTTRAPLASPALSGVPTAPTATAGTNTTQIATTAFVLANGSGGVPAAATPLVDSGSGTVGTATKYAREDHVHPTDTSRAPYDALAYNNIIINGGMEVDQANAGAAINPATNIFSLDMYLGTVIGTAVIALQQSTDAPPGFSNSLKVTVSTAQATIGASDDINFQQRVEGVRTSCLQYGTSNAQPSVLSFWTKIHRTGTYGGSLRNGAGTRSFPFTFTQNVADTWEYKTVAIPGDTTGTWVGNSNQISHQVFFALGMGSSLSGTPGSWQTGNFLGATGTVNGVAATTDVFMLSGLAWVPGTDAPTAARSPFLKRTFSETLQLCKRYFCSDFPPGTAPADNIQSQKSGGFAGGNVTGLIGMKQTFPVTMRAVPTMTYYSSNVKASPAAGQWQYFNGSAYVDGSSTGTFTVFADGFSATLTTAANVTLNGGYIMAGSWKADARL